MPKHKKLGGLRRSLLIAALLAGLAGSAAFAILQSQANTLTGNTISTATADLQLSTDGVNYTSSHIGFDFNNIVPGGGAVPTSGYPFYLKNAGGTPLAIKFAVTGTPSNPDGVDLTKVNVILTTVASGLNPQTFSLQSLMDAAATGGIQVSANNLDVGVTQQYKLQVSMAADAFSGSSASLGNIDFSFSGVVQ